MEAVAMEQKWMEKLLRAWLRFRQWPMIGQRAAIATACYLMWLFSIWLYSLGLHSTGEFIGAVFAFACFFAAGGEYVVRGAFFLLKWWLRIF
ncbi:MULTISPECIES: hypothetical protein [unclassified Paraburkholderia]|uniref:hypothetical protein n=1 Tax=unclassified Paraburkholderia TaxID=2615204 RepID=UPI002AB17CCF|nr:MULTISPECIES: hypothetical protein [unclassified Paraburkholderia]